MEVTGQAGPGLQAPHVFHADYRVIGTAPLPAPRQTSPARLAIGEEFGQWGFFGRERCKTSCSIRNSFLAPVAGRRETTLRGEHPPERSPRRCHPIGWARAWRSKGSAGRKPGLTGCRRGSGFIRRGPTRSRFCAVGQTNQFAVPLCSVRSLASQPGMRDQRVPRRGQRHSVAPRSIAFSAGRYYGAIQARLLQTHFHGALHLERQYRQRV